MTGGAKRIGRAIVEDLAAHGFGVAIHCNHSRKEAEDLAADISAGGGRAAVVQADLTDTRCACDGLIAEAAAALGPIDLLVNNASVFEDDSADDFDWDGLGPAFRPACEGAGRCWRGDFAAALPEDAKGLIVNIIDQRVWTPTPRYFSYTLSKSALWTATQTMAQALAPRDPRQRHRPRPDAAERAAAAGGLRKRRSTA